MREVYRIPWTRAVAVLLQTDERLWFVQSIFVPPTLRRNGHGTTLLTCICADADADGVTLGLAVQPQGGRKAMIYGELVRWYAKHGFVMDHDNVMVRQPKGDPCVSGRKATARSARHASTARSRSQVSDTR